MQLFAACRSFLLNLCYITSLTSQATQEIILGGFKVSLTSQASRQSALINHWLHVMHNTNIIRPTLSNVEPCYNQDNESHP